MWDMLLRVPQLGPTVGPGNVRPKSRPHDGWQELTTAILSFLVNLIFINDPIAHRIGPQFILSW